eukprot:m.155973 g.155973  ORF g.155973 m.155973 type:complete len:355 (+) comp23599_c0_seq1:817-1881(+)
MLDSSSIALSNNTRACANCPICISRLASSCCWLAASRIRLYGSNTTRVAPSARVCTVPTLTSERDASACVAPGSTTIGPTGFWWYVADRAAACARTTAFLTSSTTTPCVADAQAVPLTVTRQSSGRSPAAAAGPTASTPATKIGPSPLSVIPRPLRVCASGITTLWRRRWPNVSRRVTPNTTLRSGPACRRPLPRLGFITSSAVCPPGVPGDTCIGFHVPFSRSSDAGFLWCGDDVVTGPPPRSPNNNGGPLPPCSEVPAEAQPQSSGSSKSSSLADGANISIDASSTIESESSLSVPLECRRLRRRFLAFVWSSPERLTQRTRRTTTTMHITATNARTAIIAISTTDAIIAGA